MFTLHNIFIHDKMQSILEDIMEELTEKQRKMVMHYVINGNKIAAYRHAFDTSSKNYPTVAGGAYKMFRQDKIVRAIEELTERMNRFEDEALARGCEERISELLRESAQKRAFEKLREVDEVLIKARQLLHEQTYA
jgi:hypothetical protein